MATFQSDLKAGQTAKGDNRVDGRLLAGKVRQSNAIVALDSGIAGGDVLEVVELPKGTLLDLESSFLFADASVGTALEVVLRPKDGSNLTTDIVLTGATDPVVIGGGIIELGDETEMELLVTTATAVSGSAKVRVCLQFIDRN